MEKIVCGGNFTTNLIKDNINDLIDESVLVKGDVTTLQTDSTSLRTDVDSLKENTTLYNGIKTLPQIEGTVLNVRGFYADTSVGGGQFYYDPLKDKTEHNGGTVIAPEAIAAWDGSQGDLATLLDWSGTGSGCWIRVKPTGCVTEFGAVSADDSAVVYKKIITIGGNFTIPKSFNFNVSTATATVNTSVLKIKGECRDTSVLTLGDNSEIRVNSSVLVSDVKLNYSGSSTSQKFLDLDYATSDVGIVSVNDSNIDGLYRLIHGADIKPHDNTYNIIESNGCVIISIKDKVVKSASIKCNKYSIKNNILVSSLMGGWTCGYISEDGLNLTMSDVKKVEMTGNVVMSISPNLVPSSGSNAFYASGMDVLIGNNRVENHASTNASVQVDCETVYTKSRNTKVLGNTFLNCAGNQGVVTLKGGTKAGVTLPNAYNHEVNGNSFINESKIGQFANSVCVYIQSEDVIISNNFAKGINYKIVEVNANSLPLVNIKTTRWTLDDCPCFVSFDFVGSIDTIRVDGVKSQNFDSAADRDMVRLFAGAGKVIKDVKINDITADTVLGTGRYKLLNVDGEGSISSVSIKESQGSGLRRAILKSGTQVFGGFNLSDNDFSSMNVNEWITVSAGSLTGVNAKSNNILKLSATRNLGSIPANGKFYEFVPLSGVEAGDGIEYTIVAPANILHSMTTATDGIGIQVLSVHNTVATDMTVTPINVDIFYKNKTIQV